MEESLRCKASDFARHRGTLEPSMAESRFIELLKAAEDVAELEARISAHASLSYAEDTQSEKLAAKLTHTNQMESEVSNDMLFFDIWWKGLDDANATRMLAPAGDLTEYLAHKRRMAKYTLAEGEERVANLLEVTGSAALIKIYDTITNAYTYSITVDGKPKTCNREQLTVYVRSPIPQYRRDAYQTLLSRYSSERNVLGEIYHNIALRYHNEYVTLRGFDSPISVMNAQSNLDDVTVESLLDVCRQGSAVFQRYFIQKAAMLGTDRLERYDLYAPPGHGDRQYKYEDAVRLVLKTISNFSDTLGGYARSVFEQEHVHSTIQKGKISGAFCSTVSPAITPYVLLNYMGDLRDVFTMAHELGHAIHSMAASSHSIFVQHAPLPLAETASTFSEMLLFDAISGDLDTDEEEAILANKLDDMYATILRQAYFTIFEIKAHQRLVDGATPGDISAIYSSTLDEEFGDTVSISDDFASEWLAIPHFYHSPFYCYSYSFGNLLAASLFQRYKKEGGDFADTYLGILAAGGSKKPEPLLAEYGFDIASRNFWREGFEYVKSLANRLDDIKGLAA